MTSPHCNVPNHVHANAVIWNHATDVKYDDLEVGMRLIVGDGFDCIPEFSIVEVKKTSDGPEFYVECAGPDGEHEPGSEKHMLPGQAEDDSDIVIGFRQVRASAESDPRTTDCARRQFIDAGPGIGLVDVSHL